MNINEPARKKAEYRYHDVIFYYTHPIRTIFTDPAVKEMLTKRGNKGLRFSELQALLCEELPKWYYKSCRMRRDYCQDCHKLKSCQKAWSKEWKDLIDKNKITKTVRKYPWKSNFSMALGELYDEEWINYDNGFYYPSKDLPKYLPEQIQKEKILEIVAGCPESDLFTDGAIHFLFVDEEFQDSHENLTKELSDFISSWYPRFEEMWYEHRLRLIETNLKHALKGLDTQRVMALLWMKTIAYVEQQLHAFKKDTAVFEDVLIGMRNLHKKVRKRDIKQIERESRYFRSKFGEVEKLISTVMWNQRIHSASAALEYLCKRDKVNLSTDELNEITSCLKEREYIEALFESYELNILHPFPSIIINPI